MGFVYLIFYLVTFVVLDAFVSVNHVPHLAFYSVALAASLTVDDGSQDLPSLFPILKKMNKTWAYSLRAAYLLQDNIERLVPSRLQKLQAKFCWLWEFYLNMNLHKIMQLKIKAHKG
ncbi:hypothetical protein SLA2020_443730 [Shorea laevis]